MKESKYKGQIARCEVESMVAPLRGKEPTPAWKQQFKEVLKHYDVSRMLLSELAVERGSSNALGHKYSIWTLKNMIDNFIAHKGTITWTKNAQAVVNDHLDILVNYLSKPEPVVEEPVQAVPEEEHHPSLLERLEKEYAEGKWPTVEARRKKREVEAEATTEDVPHEEEKPILKARVRKIRKHKKHHKTHNVTINIIFGR